MDVVARVEPLPVPGGSLAMAHGLLHVLAEGAALPPSCDAAFVLPGKALVAFEPLPSAPGARAMLAVDAQLRENAFRPLHASARSHAALLSLAVARRMESGPESERALVFLRGSGLVFLENGDALRFAPLSAALLPAGEPAAVWAQGPEDALAVVFQPVMPAAAKRTLAGELAARRLAHERSAGGNGSS
jgi:hypothetical protein